MDSDTFSGTNRFECIPFLEALILLLECLAPFLLVGSRHCIIVVLGRAIGINGRWKSFESAMGCSSKECLLLLGDSCCQGKLVNKPLSLRDPCERVCTTVNMHHQYVTSRIILDSCIIADVLFIVRDPLHAQRAAIHDIT